MKSAKQHSITTSLFYHLLPGVVVLLFYLLVVPWVVLNGYQPNFALIVGFAFVGIPLQLFILFREGHKLNGRFSLKGVVAFTRKMPLWQYAVFLLLFIIYAGFVSSLMQPLNNHLADSIFSWLPEWFRNSTPNFGRDISQNIIVISFSVIFLIDGIINPIVEELYFRGFLLPRISRFGVWTPLLHALLFSLAHLWQPWNVLQIFILVTPLYYLVWYKKNIIVSIIVHCTANIIGITLYFGEYLN